MHPHSPAGTPLRRALIAAASLAVLLPVSAAHAQEWPSKPLKFVVGVQAGGITDIRARRVGQGLSELLKQSVVIDNRPGASGAIAADLVAKSAPDGYTMLFGGNNEVVIGPALGMPVKYDPMRDFTPVAQASLGSPLLLANPAMGVKSMAELVEWAKARPGQLMCGTAGHATGTHFICEMFARTAKVEARSVAYKGSGPMLIDLAAGQVHIGLGYTAEVEKQYVAPGKMVPLAVLSPKRNERFPQVPTVAESGMPGLELRAWTGLFMPAGVPAEAVKRVNAAMARLVQEPAFAAWLKESGSEIVTSSPEQFRDFVRADAARWKRWSDELGIRAEGQ